MPSEAHSSLSCIRNFSIIAHIDHGKSTLADALLDATGALSERHKKNQFLDNMDLERERGITIKAQTVRLYYTAASGTKYQLNLIDTPGHVDFSYEVSRSLAACEGALLVVDAAQGVQAQTLANTYLAIENDLELIPVFNKVDLPAADPDRVAQNLYDLIGVEGGILASAKTRMGITEILEAVVEKIPPPQVEDASRDHLRALVFDSWFDTYQGVVILCRIVSGTLKKGETIQFVMTGRQYEVLSLGVNSPFPTELAELKTGEVGFVICGIKDIRDVQVGDTVVPSNESSPQALPGFKQVKPMVFSGVFPVDASHFGKLKDSLGKLSLSDSSLHYEVESSGALGMGFRCGFLGLLHMEIIQERLEREFDLDLITTAPSVVYRVTETDGKEYEIEKPADLPVATKIQKIEEPVMKVRIHTPAEYLGGILKLCESCRGQQQHMDFLSGEQVIVEYHVPMNEMVLDFYDRLKSLSKGYASMDYELFEFQPANLQRLDIMLNGDLVDALSSVVHKTRSYTLGRELTKKIKDILPRQQFKIAIQACVGSNIIARETLSAFRKDVTAKVYGRDVTRKRKLLEKQKEGKKRMKQIGSVDVPQEAFLAILKISR